jgi:hypothetical protein
MGLEREPSNKSSIRETSINDIDLQTWQQIIYYLKQFPTSIIRSNLREPECPTIEFVCPTILQDF